MSSVYLDTLVVSVPPGPTPAAVWASAGLNFVFCILLCHSICFCFPLMSPVAFIFTNLSINGDYYSNFKPKYSQIIDVRQSWVAGRANALESVISLFQHHHHFFPQFAYLTQIPTADCIITCCLSKSGANYMQFGSANWMERYKFTLCFDMINMCLSLSVRKVFFLETSSCTQGVMGISLFVMKRGRPGYWAMATENHSSSNENTRKRMSLVISKKLRAELLQQ